MNERKLAPTRAAVRLLEGDYYSTADAWNLACSDDFAAGVGIALGVRSPGDLAGRRTGLQLRVPGEDMHPDGRAARAARIAGYEWARQFRDNGPALTARKGITMRYRVTLRSGTVRDYATKREALRAYRAEVRDGWPSSVTDLATGERII